MSGQIAVELFRDFWWLMFPVFGMVMAAWGMARDRRDADEVIARARRDLEGGK
jgi:hypothetical protein